MEMTITVALKSQINILYIEDSPNDAELVDQELIRSGLAFSATRVDTRKGFLQELDTHPPDVILSDHGLPAFDGLTALAIAREKCPDVPFIFVSGSPGRAAMTETFERGAADYVLKDRLDQLGRAVRRALHDAEDRRLRKLAEEDREQLIRELQEAHARLKTLSDLIPICSSCRKVRDEQDCWRPLETFLAEHMHLQFTHGLCPECLPRFLPNRPNGGN